MIYFDNAATTIQKPQCVIDAVVSAMQTMGNSARGTHGCSLTASRSIYGAREKLAHLFGCKRAEHVVFTANSTEALNIAISGMFACGDHIISTDLEHNSVLRPLYRLEQQGVELSFVPADKMGNIDYADFGRFIRPNTKAIVCTHASNLIGNMLDISRIGEIAQRNGLFLIVDASQTAGSIPIDMETMQIDVLCFTGHKALMAPQGTGGLCIREGINIRPWKVGGSGIKTYLTDQPEELPARLEAGTLNGHGIAGLSAAVDYINEIGISAIHQKELELTYRFYEGVKAIDGVRIYGDFAATDRAPIVALNIGDYDSSEVADELWEAYGIATRPGSHCAPRMHRALGTEEQGAVRFSFGWFNTDEEVDESIEAIRKMVNE